ncbi:hypothetical protein SAMN05519104_5953 [Rhizobiales bacterium GAS188]|nr:hypothetical protein SAMN05519104_5953 [Rhizobiales bacterium GAS188]
MRAYLLTPREEFVTKMNLDRPYESNGDRINSAAPYC